MPKKAGMESCPARRTFSTSYRKGRNRFVSQDAWETKRDCDDDDRQAFCCVPLTLLGMASEQCRLQIRCEEGDIGRPDTGSIGSGPLFRT
ncbi:CAMK protein kinase [Pseudozyma hubeiensis SY62]|uniref:CAMK protein kinase n=1 Tax=Pseudozyma hubeiensis (strain SY62) TaxID=1305764 RepID=R9PAB6_PSEHS|nr:CAMK protein kinase [Pseudozyma hubeiensis SY62]GAC98306.1 CAMK protein kinase [Pseudozyma hubeiensis SY62]